MNPNTELLALHDLAKGTLLDWLDNPPQDLRQKRALVLLADAAQNLYAACINLTDEKPL